MIQSRIILINKQGIENQLTSRLYKTMGVPIFCMVVKPEIEESSKDGFSEKIERAMIPGDLNICYI